MAEALGGWANPSSVHAEGRAARALLEEARHRILKGLGAWSGARLVFTSGATEALALALSRTRADHVLVGATEHDAVLRAAPDAPRIAVDRSGLADLEAQIGGAHVGTPVTNAHRVCRLLLIKKNNIRHN